jgi:hypothetical protein
MVRKDNMPEICNHFMYFWKKEDNGDGRWKRTKMCANPKCGKELEVVYEVKKNKDRN